MLQLTNQPIRVILEPNGFNSHDFFPAFIALLIVFIGWWIQRKLLDKQFQIQKECEKAKEKDANFLSLNMALFAVFSQWSSISNLKETLIKHKDDERRWSTLPVIPKSEKATPRIDINLMSSFLLSADANLLSNLCLLQKSRDLYFHIINQRNKTRRLLNKRMLSGQLCTDLETELKELTNSLYSGFNKLVSDYKSARTDLQNVCKKNFPERTPLHFEMKDEEGIKYKS